MEISYPDLPVSARKDEISAAIRDHQVIVVAGETGSGKTTQLPKICLDLGRRIIGHTQPRRLAARTVAQRIADELQVPLGDLVGFSVRFTDQVSKQTRIRLMTDGILLNEITRDRNLRRYDTLILDEAHERSLNVDFLLGYLRELLPRRRDLKLIITSATIDPQRFADYYSAALGVAVPVIEVSGRTYPVEIRYRPLEEEIEDEDGVILSEQRDEIEGILAAVRELDQEPVKGDILIFLSGEREIRDTAEALNGLKLYDTEVLPLYARLSTAEQQRVFQEHSKRRIVLATNVAETSLTVPGIKYVIDPGTARISRYNRRTKVQRLPIEPISQASANQRSGRSGRTSDGICIRLYAQADFEARPRFTDPEILRTNLASVLLQMANLKLGSVDDFGFLDPPDRRAVRDGVLLLEELGAMDSEAAISPLGKRLARLPVDPRIGRMILQAEREGCVREVLILAAALSIPDPRERPAEHQEKARQLHARFADPDSDFTALLNLWTYLAEKRKELSGNGFRRLCREEFLHYLRLREWQDLRGQLRSIARELGIAENQEPAGSDRIHAALLSGLLSHVGLRDVAAPPTAKIARSGGDSRIFTGARNTKFVLAPGSPLSTKPPRWVVAAELVETSRLFGRTAARIDPATLEPLAEHLVQRTYSEPQWDARRGGAVAYERVTLYGLPIVARRAVGYGRIDPAHARELFIQHALVEGSGGTPTSEGVAGGGGMTRHRFFAKNQELRGELAALEERARRGDLIVGDEAIFAFYDSKIPAKVSSQRHFDAWWKKQRHESPDLLTMSRDDLLAKGFGEDESAATAFPKQWHSATGTFPISYRFEPGAEDDGVTLHVPADVLTRLGGNDLAAFSWQIPAMREELVTALLRSLPKDLRRAFVPIPDTARAVLASVVELLRKREVPPVDTTEPILDVLQRALFDRSGVLVPLDAFDLDKLPPHLRMNFAITEDGRELARGRDLAELQRELFPTVVEPVETVDPIGAQREQLRAQLPSPNKVVERSLSQRARLVLGSNPDGNLTALLNDCADATVEAMLLAGRTPDEIRMDLIGETEKTLALAEKVLTAALEARRLLPDRPTDALKSAVADVKAQLARLLPAGFVTITGVARLRDLARYLTASGRRLEALPRDIETDRGRMQRVAAVQNAYDDLVRSLPVARTQREDVRDIAWFIEEFRVSLWAQSVGAARPVSEQRLYKAIDAITP
ncbi:MAG TPA: ATP-dependent RNA helicase HrpA [Jatrophihabitans sp.]